MPEGTSDLGRAVQDVAEKAQLLVREEIELAKAEMSAKVNKLIKGIVAGAVAGIFAIFGLIYLLHGFAWLLWNLIDGDGESYWLGFLIVALVLFVLGAIGGFLAARFIKRGSPPTPQMAIHEAQLIRQTLASPPSSAAVAAYGDRDRSSGSSGGDGERPAAVAVSEDRR
jgi:uncharacterized membrane protein YqjE